VEQQVHEPPERVGPPPERPKKLIPRVCLKCEQRFGAENKYLRLCEACRKSNSVIHHPQWEGW
jgi:hypothetical protein